MPIAYLETPYVRVKLHSERLVVLAPKKAQAPTNVLREIPLLGLDRVIISEHVQITTEAVAALLRRGIPLHYLDYRGGLLGQTHPDVEANAEWRLTQYRQNQDTEFSLRIARTIIATKIHNQRRLLQKADAYRDRCADEELNRFCALQTQAETATTIGSLRGTEGAASALYFQLWSRYLPKEFPFERRTAHPPLNPVNACISFTATLVYHAMICAIRCAGLDPGLGHLHVPENGRSSLALDLMEPFRPALVEALTLRMFTLSMLKPGDFEPHAGGVYLKAEPRGKLISEYERRLERTFVSAQLGHRTSLRQQIAEQAVGYKTALNRPESFKPFRLN